jgi:formylglycine-generating enzyme required for sulfatase activity
VDADAYAAWFSAKYAGRLGLPGLQVVLPTDVEWEQAARAGRWTQERQWDSGIRTGTENCDYAGSISCTSETPDPVATPGRKPNAWGLYDTIGNLWEWTSTPMSIGGEWREVRGGSFNDGGIGGNLRLSANRAHGAAVRVDLNGFRVLARIGVTTSSSTSPTR